MKNKFLLVSLVIFLIVAAFFTQGSINVKKHNKIIAIETIRTTCFKVKPQDTVCALALPYPKTLSALTGIKKVNGEEYIKVRYQIQPLHHLDGWIYVKVVTLIYE